MANQLLSLLQQWHPQRDTCEWVLGTVYKTEGPCYRKAGAMMLFNSLGQQFGLLSGGCLESDIQIHARKVMQSGKAVALIYDGSDEDDVSFQLGIGCGGKVYLMLQPVTALNGYLALDEILLRLKQRQISLFYQCIPRDECALEDKYLPEGSQNKQAFSELASGGKIAGKNSRISHKEGADWLVTTVRPDPHILLVGGGVDTQPIVGIAKQLGWLVSIWDPRPANARREFFMEADYLLKCPVEQLPEHILKERVSAAVFMSHSVALDAAALATLNGQGLNGGASEGLLEYMALLGPTNRKQQVLKLAKLEENQLRQPLHGPAGFDIGGDLPESIALSILSQCHQVLYKGEQLSMRHGLAA